MRFKQLLVRGVLATGLSSVSHGQDFFREVFADGDFQEGDGGVISIDLAGPDVFINDGFDATSDPEGETELSPTIEYSIINGGELDGDAISLNLPLPKKRFGDSRYGYQFNLPFRYRRYDEGSNLTAGLVASFPIYLIEEKVEDFSSEEDRGGRSIADGYQLSRRRADGTAWKLTPSIGGFGSFALEGADNSSFLTNFSLINSIDWHKGEFTATFGTQLSYVQGSAEGSLFGFDFDEDISETILRTGLNFEYAFRFEHKASLYGYYTGFLSDSDVSDLVTVGADYTYSPEPLDEDPYRVVYRAGVYLVESGEDYSSFNFRLGGSVIF